MPGHDGETAAAPVVVHRVRRAGGAFLEGAVVAGFRAGREAVRVVAGAVAGAR